MSQKFPKATHVGELQIGSTVIPCAVLEDGTRVVSERGVTKAQGGKRGGAHWRRRKKAGNDPGAYLPVFLSASNLKAFIPKDLDLAPIKYYYKGSIANGIKAENLPKVCEVWLRARDAGDMLASQERIAGVADILLRGLAHIGITALVDEATGYQEIRDREALQQILDKYLRKELAA